MGNSKIYPYAWCDHVPPNQCSSINYVMQCNNHWKSSSQQFTQQMGIEGVLVVDYSSCAEDIWWELEVRDVVTMAKSKCQLSSICIADMSSCYLLYHGDNRRVQNNNWWCHFLIFSANMDTHMGCIGSQLQSHWVDLHGNKGHQSENNSGNWAYECKMLPM